MGKLKIGIIGCGTIGGEIARSCEETLSGRVDLFAICDIDAKKTQALSTILKKKVSVLGLDELIENCDLVVEAASAHISADVLEKCTKAKKDCLVMSVGGLLGKEELLKRADSSGINVYIPSGALCGIDGLKAARAGRIDSVTLTTRKPPKALAGAPYLKDNNIDVFTLKEETVVFEGSAREAVTGFPQNVNVAAVLSLTGIGAEKTRVKIVTSPEYSANVHEVEMRGEFGRIVTRTENVPSKANPKTSALAILSAIATLREITSGVRIGT